VVLRRPGLSGSDLRRASPKLAPPYPRRTSTLRRLLEHIAPAGRAGARLAGRLGIVVSPTNSVAFTPAGISLGSAAPTGGRTAPGRARHGVPWVRSS